MGPCADAAPCAPPKSCPDAGPCKSCDGGCAAACPEAGACSKPQDLLPAPDKGPLKQLVDDSFADLRQGTLSESGAKIYVDATGAIRLLDLRDVDHDGHPDVVLSNYTGSSSTCFRGPITVGSTPKKLSFPTVAAMSNALADLDHDGKADLIFTSFQKGGNYNLDSYIYWAGSPSTATRTKLPTVGARDVAVADFNRDGWLDIVFANQRKSASGGSAVNSYVYYGSAKKFGAPQKDLLLTHSAVGCSVADFNRDGLLDIVFSQSTGHSLVYWGSVSGFKTGNSRLLKINSSLGNTVADFNDDGWLDIAFGREGNSGSTTTSSRIYWGAATGFSESSVSHFKTNGAHGVSAGYPGMSAQLELLFSNASSSVSASYNGMTGSTMRTFAAGASRDNMIMDISGDGLADVVFTSHSTSSTAYIYKSTTWHKVSLPTSGANRTTSTDPGSVYRREPQQTFTSRVHDTKLPTPRYLTLSWKAAVPKDTKLTFQLRSAASPLALAAAPWRGPAAGGTYVASATATSAPINPLHHGDRFIQYRATLSHKYTATPVLDRVTIGYR